MVLSHPKDLGQCFWGRFLKDSVTLSSRIIRIKMVLTNITIEVISILKIKKDLKIKELKSLLLCYKVVLFIKAIVQGSYTVGNLYHVKLKLSMNEGSVINSFCTCRAGRCGVCCHVFAVLWFF